MKRHFSNELKMVNSYRKYVKYLCLLSANDYVTMDILANELYTSKSKIYKDIKSMKELVQATKNVTLEVSKKKGIRITGEEQNIRYFISCILLFYQMTYIDYLRKMVNRFYPQQGKFDKLHYLLVDTLISQNLIITGPSMEMLTMECYITIHRILKNKKLTVVLQKEYQQIDLPFEKIEELFDVKLTDNDRICILQFLHNKRVLNSQNESSFQNQYFRDVADQFLETIRDKYNLVFLDNQKIINHVHAMLTYHHWTFRKRTMLVNEIQQNYPFAYEVSCCIIPIAKEVLNYDLMDNEVSRLAVRLVVAMDEITQRKNTIVIVNSASYAELLKFKLRHYFSEKIEFLGFCPEYQIDTLLQNNGKPIELILTTTPLLRKYEIDTLLISPILNPQDINNLNDYFFRSNRSYTKKRD
ncbi:MAG: helix-turn-helix domain-containing protein [Erysipelotrichaceae bacterium]|nr:helix-turn-helix domain-containing protein [Erysipelotrichaceae bacterium]